MACRYVVSNPRCMTQHVIRYTAVFFTTPLYLLTLLYLSTPLRGATICILQHRCILQWCCILQQCCVVDILWFMLLTNIGKILGLFNYQCCATAAGQGEPAGSLNAWFNLHCLGEYDSDPSYNVIVRYNGTVSYNALFLTTWCNLQRGFSCSALRLSVYPPPPIKSK